MVIAATIAAPRASVAQRIAGPGDDAWLLPVGVVRTSLQTRFFGASDRFNSNGDRESLGAPFAGLLGAAQFPTLASLNDDIRAASGVQTFAAILGKAAADVRRNQAMVPLSVEIGVTPRVMARVFAPFFTGLQDIAWQLDGNAASIGLNPAAAAGAAFESNRALVSAFDSAAAHLEALVGACATNPAFDSRCATVTANASAIAALIAQSRATTDAIARTYGGRTGVASALFVPLRGSAADNGVVARITSIRDGFNQYGFATVGDGVVPGGAAAPATIADIRKLLSDSTYGYVLPIDRTYKQGLGDIDLGVTLLLHDGLKSGPASRDTVRRTGWRQVAGATYRVGRGTPPDPDDPFAVPTGTGINGIELMSAADVVRGKHLWGTVLARWTMAQSRDGIARIPDSTGSPFIPLARRRNTHTELGSRFELSVAPRWTVNDYMAAGVRWSWVHQAGEKMTELAPLAGAAPMHYAAPSMSAQALSVGLTWSSLAAWQRHTTRFPVEIQWERSITVAGSGDAPRVNGDLIAVRVYGSLWGRPLR